MVNRKIFSIDQHFRLPQTPVNAKKYFLEINFR